MKKMSFGERIRITKRGFGILRKYCPGLSEQKALYEFIHSLQPFITIWFSIVKHLPLCWVNQTTDKLY